MNGKPSPKMGVVKSRESFKIWWAVEHLWNGWSYRVVKLYAYV